MRFFLCLFFACLMLPAHAEFAFDLEIDAPSAARRLLEKHLDIARAQSDDRTTAEYVDYLAITTPDEARNLLATEGFFAPQIEVRWLREEKKPRFVMTVDPGEPVRISVIRLDWQGEIRADPQYLKTLEKQIRSAWLLGEGEVFTQSKWDAGKTLVHNLTSARRFPGAKLSGSEARIDPQTHQAELVIGIDSGPFYRYGALEVSGLARYPAYLVQEQRQFAEGAEYQRSDLQELQTRLQSLPHFGFAVVDVDLGDAPPYRAGVRVDVREVPHHKLTTGVGYTTEAGFNTTLAHQYYGLFGKSWISEATLKLAQNEQSGEVALVFPRLGAGYQHRVHLAYEQSDVSSLSSKTWRQGVTRSQTDFQLTRSWSVEHESERRRLADGTLETPESLFFKFQWLRRDLDSTRDPRQGHLLQWESSAAIDGLYSDETYLRLYGRVAKYWPFSGNRLLLPRPDGGQPFAHVPAYVPSDLLFRAGGAGSVRGYDYQSLGPSKGGSVVPGRVLLTSSLEYQWPLYRDWRLASFVDHGNASTTWPELRGVTGAGLGLRWVSPAGVFGADFAHGLDDDQWKFHLAIGLVF